MRDRTKNLVPAGPLWLALGIACSSPGTEPTQEGRGTPQPLWVSEAGTIDNGDDNFQPGIAGDGAGGYLVAYHSDVCQDGCDEVHAVLIDTDASDGTWSMLPPLPIIVDDSTRSPSNVRVAESGGVYLVVWEDTIFDKSGNRGRIFGATVTATVGGAEVSGTFIISDDVGDERRPRVAGMPGGQWLVVWEDDEDGTVVIQGRLVANGGTVFGPANDDVRLTDDTGASGIETSPDVAWDGARFIITFDDDREAGDIWGAMVEVIGTSTVTAGPAFPISTDVTATNQTRSTVACRSGTCMVAWEDARNAATDASDIRGSRVVAGVPDVADISMGDGATDQSEPIVVAMIGADLASSAFVLVFSDNGNPSAMWFDPATILELAPDSALDTPLIHGAASAGPGELFLVSEITGGASSFYDLSMSYVLALPNGAPCPTSLPATGTPPSATPDDGCLFGVCALGICCNSDCAGDCATCDGIGSTTAAGTCGVRTQASNTSCRAGSADGICDPAETCDGLSVDCPVDRVRTSTEACRPAGAEPTCDVTELCTGVALADCPADAFKASGDACRAGSGDLCDPDETCSGTTADCPVDLVRADGDPCDSDTLICNGRAACGAGTCVDLGVPQCDDGDPCTTDSCVEPSGCSNTRIAGCGVDAGTPDSGTPRPDAGFAVDAGEEPSDVKDCDCSATQFDRGMGSELLFLGLGVLLLSRRRLRA